MTRGRPFHRHPLPVLGLTSARTQRPPALRGPSAATSRITFPCSHAPRRANRLSPTSVYPPCRAVTLLLLPHVARARHSGYTALRLSLIHISEPTRLLSISYA